MSSSSPTVKRERVAKPGYLKIRSLTPRFDISKLNIQVFVWSNIIVSDICLYRNVYVGVWIAMENMTTPQQCKIFNRIGNALEMILDRDKDYSKFWIRFHLFAHCKSASEQQLINTVKAIDGLKTYNDGHGSPETGYHLYLCTWGKSKKTNLESQLVCGDFRPDYYLMINASKYFKPDLFQNYDPCESFSRVEETPDKNHKVFCKSVHNTPTQLYEKILKLLALYNKLAEETLTLTPIKQQQSE